MAKGEISWKRRTAEGLRLQVYAHRNKDRWEFFVREKRFDRWQSLTDPTLEDWLQLLDGVERRVGRRLIRPEEVDRVRRLIRERFPDAG